MLTRLVEKVKKGLLEILNCSWRKGLIAKGWREPILIPTLKKGKIPTYPNSYRPISLLCCTGKLLEHMVNTRLVWHLEEKELTIKPASQVQTTQIQKAVDKVWKTGLKVKLSRSQGSGRVYRWIC